MKILTTTRAAASGVAVAALAAAGAVLGAAPAEAAPTSTWDRLAMCESSGNWHINTGNGYYGGLQFNLGTWQGHGGPGRPDTASKATQIKIAERVLASQGWGAWPACSAKLGLRGTSSSVAAETVTTKSHTATAQKATSSPARHRAEVRLSGRTVVVRSGDTLAGIAAAHRVHGGWARLADANHLENPNLIRVGQHLHLPA